MKIVTILAGAALLFLTGCVMDSGPTLTATQEVDAGKAEAVRASIHMGAGELRIEGGAPKLLAASFHYSERLGRPVVNYEETGAEGRLTVESPRGPSSAGAKTVNEWELRMGSGIPLDLSLSLSAGESHLDLTQISLRSLDVSAGAGEMELNMAAQYSRDIAVEINGGVGNARIHLPGESGAVVEVHGGLGDVSARGLTKRDGKYYNDAYREGEPAVHMSVRGGVGNVELSVGAAQQSN